MYIYKGVLIEYLRNLHFHTHTHTHSHPHAHTQYVYNERVRDGERGR
jgi:hypothetical protein